MNTELLHSVLAYVPYAILGALIILVLLKSFVIAKGDQIVVLERRWFGKQMPEGRTIALSGEVGLQARVLGPGFHWLFPFIYKTEKKPFMTIGKTQYGTVFAIAGKSLPAGSIFAKNVDCNLFQDGETFLKTGGEKGVQLGVLPDGQYQINPYLFRVEIREKVIIADGEVGIVQSVAGQPIEQGRIFARVVECDYYQNAAAFLSNGGERGPQILILPPGAYRINSEIFKIKKDKMTIVKEGHIRLVMANDGGVIEEGLLGKKIEGHKNFEKGEVFLKNGGQKGRQIEYLMPGAYRINTDLFEVSEEIPWVYVGPEEVGIVTVLEGKPLSDDKQIAANIINLDVHNNFQNPEAYLAAGGQKGLQIPVLRSGNYAINNWFAKVDKVPMIEVKIGECAVITSFVGIDGIDQTGEEVNAKIVANGEKGIWKEPYGPGRYALNTKICKVDIVPTTQILLNWADNQSSAHKYDSNLKTITLRTSDAFNVNMDVSVIIHIGMADAPKVIANLGSVSNMISQVLEPAISSHFRNAAQSVQALDLYTKRAEIQENAKVHIQEVLKMHHIESKDTMIADVVLPEVLTKTVTDRQIAEQEKQTFVIQKQAQEERRSLANAAAQADMQTDVVKSERNVEISENQAKSAVAASKGEAETVKIKAEAAAQAKKIEASAQAYATTETGKAEAAIISTKGEAEAKVIEAKGKANAEAYKEQANAIGKDNLAQMKITEFIAGSKLKLMPDSLIIGGTASGGGNMEGLLGLNLLEQMKGSVNKAASKETES